MKIIYVDIDETICKTSEDRKYENSEPIQQNIDKINWCGLWCNENPEAIDIIKDNREFCFECEEFFWMCSNKNAISMIEESFEYLKIHDLVRLCSNKNAVHLIAPLDHEYMKEANKIFKEELVRKVFNPVRMNKICEMVGMELCDYVDCI